MISLLYNNIKNIPNKCPQKRLKQYTFVELINDNPYKCTQKITTTIVEYGKRFLRSTRGLCQYTHISCDTFNNLYSLVVCL